MAGSEIPGLEAIQSAAAMHGIDISAEVEKAQLIMQTDPAALRAASQQVQSMKAQLGTSQSDLQQAGNQALNSWTGESANAYAQHNAGLVGHVADTANNMTQLHTKLDNHATSFDQGQHIVLSSTAMSASYLGMQGKTP